MATSNGIISIKGKLGDLIFYRVGKKVLIRKQAEEYQLSDNSKKSGKDFGEVSKLVAYIKKGFELFVKNYALGELHSRLNKRIHEIFRTIPAVYLGHKQLSKGNINLLKGFEFNKTTALGSLLYQVPGAYPSPDGILDLTLPKASLSKFCKQVPRATKLLLQLHIFHFDLAGDDYEIHLIQNLEISLKQANFPGASLQVETNRAGERALLIAVGASYWLEQDKLADRRYFACRLTHVFHLRDGLPVPFVQEQKQAIAPVEEISGLSWRLNED
ncbi:hypothetical protein [Pedobacter sp.]|uniref:hypothetical protein n=1 Tax=Pedobacter sp. TaxID=1411316 RepID=UPI003BAD55D9